MADVAEAVEVEPTFEELEKMAAKQLMAELLMLRKQMMGIQMNGMMLVQCRAVVRGLITKYRNIGVFQEDDIKVEFLRKQNRVEFVPSPYLEKLFNAISTELAAEAAKKEEDGTTEI